MTIGEKIKAARQKARISQKELADRLGITNAGISQWETDKRTPKIDSMIKIADAIGVNLAELLGAEKENAERISQSANCFKLYEKQLNEAERNNAPKQEVDEINLRLQTVKEELTADLILIKAEHQKDLAQKRFNQTKEKKELEEYRNRKKRTEEQTVRPENKLIAIYELLNDEGRTELIKRAEEMICLRQYRN